MQKPEGGSFHSFYRDKMVFTIKWLVTAYKMSGPNPKQNTIFWGVLTQITEVLSAEITIKWLVPNPDGQRTTQQIS